MSYSLIELYILSLKTKKATPSTVVKASFVFFLKGPFNSLYMVLN